jgi:xylose dehydrogenase (NAD/NADP)
MKKISWAILGAARVNEKLIPAIINSKQGKLVAIGSRRKNAAEEVCRETYKQNRMSHRF